MSVLVLLSQLPPQVLNHVIEFLPFERSQKMQRKTCNAMANQTKQRCTKHPPHATHSLSEHRQRHIASIAALRPAFCFISDPHDGSIVSAPYFFHRSEFFFIHYRQRSLGAYDGDDDVDARRRPLRVILFFTTQQRTYFTLSLLFFPYPRYCN